MLLFISYAHEDLQLVKKNVVEILVAAGHEAWFDHHLQIGFAWKPQLLAAIQECEAFVYAITPKSLDSEWCQWEYAQAVKLRKRIIPVLLKPVKIPSSLSEIQYADFTRGAAGTEVARFVSSMYTKPKFISPDLVVDAPTEPKGVPAQLAHLTDAEIEMLRRETKTFVEEEKANEPDLSIAKAYFDQGLSAAKNGDYQQAIAHYSRTIELDPKYVAAYNNRGIAYINLGEYEHAIRDLTKSTYLSPDLANPHGVLGDVYYTLEHFEESLAAYRRYVQLTDEAVAPFVQHRIEELEEILLYAEE